MQVKSPSKPPKTIRARGNTQSSELKSQRSKHGFYDEFSVVPTANDSFRLKKGTRSTWERFSNSFKPAPDQTRCNKCMENMESCCTKKCAFHLFPILLWLPHYKLAWMKKDLMAGITVSILLVPQSLAYATLAGLPPEWGLYASVMPIIFYTFWSTSCAVAVGPVAPTAIMVASAVEGIMTGFSDISQSDPDYDELYQSIAMTLSFVCGIILIIFGLIRAGFIVVFLSRPVMTGFIMSAAFIIAVNQCRGLLGLEMDRYPLFYETLIAVFQNLDTINWYTALISAVSLFLLFLPKCCLKGKIPKWVPMPLIVIVMWILISYFADLESVGVSIIGNSIKSGFPMPKAPNFDYIGDVFASAIVVAIVSYMGSIALAKGFDQKRQETYKIELNAYNVYCRDNVGTVELIISNENNNKIDTNDTIPTPKVSNTTDDAFSPNTNISSNTTDTKMPLMATEDEEDDNNIKQEEKRNKKQPTKPLSLPSIALSPNMEFIAYGISNLLGSFFSSQVISASFSRSALNFDMTGWTQISSIIQAIICLLCLLFLMPLLSPLPNCVLASLVTVSVYRLIKNGIYELIFLCRVSRIELIEFAVASIAPLVIGLEVGIFLAIGTSILVNLLRHSFTSIIFLGRLQSTMSDEAEYVDCVLFKSAKSVPHITIIEMKAELSFSNNNRLVEKIRRLLAGGNKYIVVSLNLTSFIDTTAIRQIVTIFEDSKGSYICLSQCRPQVIELIHRYETDTDEFPDNVKTFISTHDAVLWLNSIRSKLMHNSVDYNSSDVSDEDLSSFSKPSLDNHYNTVTPQIGSYVPNLNKELSDLDMMNQQNSVRRHVYSFRARNKSHSNHEQIGTDSDEHTDREKKDENINENANENGNENENKHQSISPNIEMENLIVPVDTKTNAVLRLSVSSNIEKIYENKESEPQNLLHDNRNDIEPKDSNS